jgi:hypothetical protein
MKITLFLIWEWLVELNVCRTLAISSLDRVEMTFLTILGGFIPAARLVLVKFSLSIQLENAHRVLTCPCIVDEERGSLVGGLLGWFSKRCLAIR